MKPRTRNILLALALILIVVLAAYGRKKALLPPQPIATIAFSCNSGKGIIAAFFDGPTKPAASPGEPPTPGGTVALLLSDGRSMTLAQTISADGGRYANADESFIFWEKGNSALVLEGGKEADYTGCIAIAPQPADANLPLVYSNSADHFSIRLPAGYSMNETYRYQELGPGKDIAGIKFTIASTTAAGTNLSADSYISVESIPLSRPQSDACNAGLFLSPATPKPLVEGSTTYSVASQNGAAAGNRYAETVFAIPDTNPCIAVRYFIHSTVLENYPPGRVQPFDGQALIKEFDAIRRTLVIAPSF
ncbi:MliC family protein [Patescibacteria group bacterium]|nr:MliC family protein [Patescibacteria group bacterium]